MSKGIFITATGTDVGKTYITALMLKKLRDNGLNAGYYKGALSGAQELDGVWIAGDAQYVCEISGLTYSPREMVSYIYKAALSPHLAARLEKNPVCLDVIMKDFQRLKSKYDYLCVEGSGGIICPLRIDDEQIILLEDMVKALGLSTIIVASSELGTINSTLLTVNYLRAQSIKISGIIINNYDKNNFMHNDNKKQIELLSKIPVIACVANGATEIDISAEMLQGICEEI